jgi:hypothetical protein
MKFHRWCLVYLAALLAVPPLAADDYLAIHGRIVTAWRQGDMPAFAAAVREGLAHRPDYPPMLYNLAIAEARLQQPANALALLHRLAEMGLVFPTDEQVFPELVAAPRFAPIAARLAANGEPAGTAAPYLIAEGETAFLPEGIALDPASGTLFLGSVRQGEILRFHPADGRSVFAADDPQHLWGVFGMAVAEGILWVATSAVEEATTAPPEVRGRAAVNGYRLDDGRRVLHCPWPGEAVFGDLLPDDGGAWISDSTGRVLFLDPDGCRYRELVPPGAMVSPQGIAPDGETHLVVADYRGGLFRVRKADGHLARISTPPDVTLYGIDGLYRAGAWLIAVQNGLAPHRVVALRLSRDSASVVEMRVLAAALPQFDEPTLGVVHGDHFLFVANAGWQHYAGDEVAPTSAPLVLSVRLPGEH